MPKGWQRGVRARLHKRPCRLSKSGGLFVGVRGTKSECDTAKGARLHSSEQWRTMGCLERNRVDRERWTKRERRFTPRATGLWCFIAPPKWEAGVSSNATAWVESGRGAAKRVCAETMPVGGLAAAAGQITAQPYGAFYCNEQPAPTSSTGSRATALSALAAGGMRRPVIRPPERLLKSGPAAVPGAGKVNRRRHTCSANRWIGRELLTAKRPISTLGERLVCSAFCSILLTHHLAGREFSAFHARDSSIGQSSEVGRGFLLLLGEDDPGPGDGDGARLQPAGSSRATSAGCRPQSLRGDDSCRHCVRSRFNTLLHCCMSRRGSELCWSGSTQRAATACRPHARAVSSRRRVGRVSGSGSGAL